MTFQTGAAPQSYNRRQRTGSWPEVRSDSAITEEIWDRYQKTDLQALTPEHLSVNVEYGQVVLHGHVKEDRDRWQAQNLAARVRGVTGVDNRLVTDEEVYRAVLRALAANEHTAPYLIPVRVHYGWTSLDGQVPAVEIAQAAGEAAARVPTVRGVIALPWVLGLRWAEEGELPKWLQRRTFQPRPGTPVYGPANGRRARPAGRVSQIVIDPGSRLVSHLGIRPSGDERHERVVPITAVEAANQEEVWLKEGESIRAYPVFHPAEFPLAPPAWQAPFPYEASEVRWELRAF